MWNKPWKYKEGTAIGAGLIITGALLQFTIGRVNWDLLAAPVNYAALCIFVLLLAAAHILRKKVYFFVWLSTPAAAVTSIAAASLMTVLMGLIKQVPSSAADTGFPGLDQMLSNWSFVLIYIWMVISLGLTVLRVCIPFKASKIPFLLSHLGLFTALTCGVLGSADLQRLNMTTSIGTTEWRAYDDAGALHELPLAVELKDFTIDEYPPKLLVADNATGQALPAGAPENVLLEDGIASGNIAGYDISILRLLPESAPVITADTIYYNEFHSTGSCASAYIRASRGHSPAVEGWVSCGSYAFPFKSLKVDDRVSVVMPEREPRRFVSSVQIYTQSGRSFSDTIRVNSPCRVEGWKIYQLNYDSEMGRWSRTSVFEIVRDPWMPAVYAGIWMLITGAVCMFVQSGRKKEVRK